MNFDEKVQLIIIGDSAVGKTSILKRYSNKKIDESHMATVGIDNFERDETFEGEIIRVKVWDTAGQERFRAITQSFYKKSHGVILVYDVASKTSFDNIKYWSNSIKTNCGENWFEKTILLGNKVDLPREVEYTEALTLSEKLKIKYFECSANENSNIREPIRELVRTVRDSFETKKTEGKLMSFISKNNKCNC